MRELEIAEIDQVSGGWGKIVGEIIGAFIVGLGGAIAKDQYDKSQENNSNDNDNDSGGGGGS